MAYVNKVVYGDRVLIDLTKDTIEQRALLRGYTAHLPDGSLVQGSCPFDVDSTDATAKKSEILSGKTAYVNGTKLEGTMPNNGSVDGVLTEKTSVYTIPQGYHDGSGLVKILETEQEKIIPTNIRQGITILGVTGTMSGSEGVVPQSKVVTPKAYSQEVLPDEGYNYLSAVTVNPIPYVENTNAAGGLTVTIG